MKPKERPKEIMQCTNHASRPASHAARAHIVPPPTTTATGRLLSCINPDLVPSSCLPSYPAATLPTHLLLIASPEHLLKRRLDFVVSTHLVGVEIQRLPQVGTRTQQQVAHVQHLLWSHLQRHANPKDFVTCKSRSSIQVPKWRETRGSLAAREEAGMCGPQARCWWRSTPDPAVAMFTHKPICQRQSTPTRTAFATAALPATCTQTTLKTAHLVSQQQAIEQLDG